MRKGVLLICGMVLAVVAGILFSEIIYPVKVDNEKQIEEIVSTYYSDLLLDTISGFVDNEELYRDVYLKDIEKLYDLDIECKRRSISGDYYVLASESGTRAFIFVNADDMIEEVVVLKYTVSYDDLLVLTESWGNALCNGNIVLGAEIMSWGNATMSVCYAAPCGVVIVDYGLWTQLGSGAEVVSVEYIDDSTLQSLSSSECWYAEHVILPIDKVGLPAFETGDGGAS